MKERYLKKMKGFTLIELIVVIVILGILAAVAVPRFMSQSSAGRISALNGLAGNIAGAVNISQAVYRSLGNTAGSSATSIILDGTTVTVSAGTGFPAAVTGGIDSALRSYTGFQVSFASGVATFNFAPSITNCNLTYTASTGRTALVTSGC